tara:strand:+ start:637 stop:861 length:225 start_codon:yes stop_codon:yes gene_type:complete
MQDTTKQIRGFYEIKVLPGGAAELGEIAVKMVERNATAESGTLELLSECGHKEGQKYCKTVAKRELAVIQRATE